MGWGDWYAENGVWQVGTPTNGPGQAYEGTSCAATGLWGNYPGYTDSRLISPGVLLPAVNTGESIVLRFRHWFAYAEVRGEVQISVWNSRLGDPSRR